MIDSRNADALTLWKRAAYLTIVALALTLDEFTSDEFWQRFEDLPQHPEPRALGSVFIAAKNAGIIVESGTYRKSTRAACHSRPIVVYRSAIRKSMLDGKELPSNVIPIRRDSAGSLLSTG